MKSRYLINLHNFGFAGIFLLTIINQCLKEHSLKKLLDEKSLELLNHCFKITKPGIRLVCRLYWRQHGWYKKEKLVQIIDDNKEAVGDSQFEEMLNSLVENGLVTPSGNLGKLVNMCFSLVLMP